MFMGRLRSIAEFLALRRNTTLLLAALVLALTGERLWLNFASKYLETLGAGILVIGLFDALLTLLGAAFSILIATNWELCVQAAKLSGASQAATAGGGLVVIAGVERH